MRGAGTYPNRHDRFRNPPEMIDAATAIARCADLVETARGEGNTIAPMLEAARAEATLGEICGVLRDLWGNYSEPPRF